MRSLPAVLWILILAPCVTSPASAQDPCDVDVATTVALEHLASIEPQVRVMGAQALGELKAGSSESVLALAVALSDDPEVAAAAFYALRQISDVNQASLKPALPKLVLRLSSLDANHACEACDLLAKAGPLAAEFSRDIRLALDRTRSRAVCDRLSYLLWRMGDTGLAELIRATDSRDPYTQQAAAWVIEQYDCQTNESVSMLAGVLRWGTPSARNAALVALRKAGPRASCVAHHIAHAANDPETACKAVAAILEMPCDPKVRVAALVSGYYQSSDPQTRFVAIRALRKFPRDRRALNAQLDAALDGRWLWVQLAAIENLRVFPDAASWSPRLVEILDVADEDWTGSGGWELQVAAAATLVAVGQRQEAAFPFLLKAIKEHDDKHQHGDYGEDWRFHPARAAAEGLRCLERGSPMARRALPALEREMKKSEYGGKAELATAIFALHPDRIVATAKLCAFLESMPALGPVAEESARVCRWLVGHEHADLALEFLIRSLETERPLGRERAAAVLSEIGPRARPSLPALEACLKSDDEDVRTAAAAAIDRIRGEPQTSNEIASSASTSR